MRRGLEFRRSRCACQPDLDEVIKLGYYCIDSASDRLSEKICRHENSARPYRYLVDSDKGIYDIFPTVVVHGRALIQGSAMTLAGPNVYRAGNRVVAQRKSFTVLTRFSSLTRPIS